MKKIYLLSSNSHKIQEFRTLLKKTNFVLEPADLPIPEIQSSSQEKVLRKKLSVAWEKIQKPVMVDDTGFYIEKYNNFPGTITKFLMKGIGLEGFWRLVKAGDKCYFRTLLGYKDNGGVRIFEGIVKGRIIEKKDFKISGKKPLISDIFVPVNSNGQPLYEANVPSHREIVTKKLIKELTRKK